MPTFEEHCDETREVLGSDHDDVHQWLDEYHGQLPFGTRHRRLRHHEEGIAEVIAIFGEEAGLAARLHIVADLTREGWKPERDYSPQNEKDHARIGLW